MSRHRSFHFALLLSSLTMFSATAAIASLAQTLTTLYNFCSQPNCIDGAESYAELVQGTDGNFYGTTHNGGTSGDGTVFKITPNGTLTTLHSFQGYPTDGSLPNTGLVQGTDGSFYGTTSKDGVNGGYGTVFKITPAGMLITLHTFNGTEGSDVIAG